jgi:hypothetical protein
LHRGRGSHRAGDGREDDEVAVTLAARLHHAAAVAAGRRGNDRVERVEDVGHVRGMVAPQTRAAFDVGEAQHDEPRVGSSRAVHGVKV